MERTAMDWFSGMDGRFESIVQMIHFDCCIFEHDRRIFME